MRLYSYAGLLAALVLLGTVLHTQTAQGQREHRVREGQTLGAIARRYNVSIADLARANRIRQTATLQIGQVLVIPGDDTITVERGQTLRTLAREHGVTVASLASENGLRANARLRPGQTLVVPTSSSESGGSGARSQWGRPRQPGLVQLSRLGRPERVRARLVDARGRVRDAARTQLSRLMRSDEGGTRLPNPRLLQQLTKISDHFGGRRIIVVSGYRPAGGYTRETSRHTRGDALDIRIDGVPITAIRDYCRTLENMGCGYYPRSQFVHVDVRERETYWVDYSGPGEAPRYTRPADATEASEDEGSSDETAAAEEGGESNAAPAEPSAAVTP